MKKLGRFLENTRARPVFQRILTTGLSTFLALSAPGGLNREALGDSGLDISKLDGQVQSPFTSCQNSGVVVLNPASYAAQKAKLQNCPDCASHVQESFNTGMFVGQVEGSNPQGTVLQATAFMHDVASKYLSNLEDNLKYQKDMAQCYSSRDQKLEDGQSSLCKLLIDGGQGTVLLSGGKTKTVQTAGADAEIAKAAPLARQELLLARGDPSSRAGQFESQGAPVDFSNISLNRTLTSCSMFGTSNPFEGTSLTPDEIATAQKQLNSDAQNILQPAFERFQAQRQARNEEARKNGRPLSISAPDEGEADSQFKTQLLSRYRDSKCQAYRQIVMQNMPIFAVIGKPTGPNGKWTDAQKAKAYGVLAKNAQNEIDRTQRSIKDGRLEWALLFKNEGECVPTEMPELDPLTGLQIGTEKTCFQKRKLDPARAWKSWVNGDRDLLDYLAFKGVVEDVLRDNPQYCGVATGLASHQFYKDLQLAVGTGVGLAVGSIAVVTGAPLLTTAAGLGATGGGLSAALGAAAGGVMTLGSMRDYYETKGQLLSYAGTGSNVAVEHPIQTLDQLDSARNQVVLTAAMNAPEVSGLFKTTQLIYAAATRKYLAEDASRLADAGSESARQAIALKNKAVFDQLLGSSADQSTKNTVERLAQDWGGANLAQTIRENPRVFDHFQKVLLDANIQGAKSPEEKLAARNMLLFFDKATSTTQAWGDEFPALAAVMKQMHDDQLIRLQTLKQSDPAQYQAELRNLQNTVEHPESHEAMQRNSQDFDKALKELGVTDDEVRSKMDVCWRTATQ